MDINNMDKEFEFNEIPVGDNADAFANLKEKLESVQKFPGEYTYKFIITGGDEAKEALKNALPNDEFKEQLSKTGKYVSITVVKTVQNADEVIEVYKKVGEIKGIMML